MDVQQIIVLVELNYDPKPCTHYVTLYDIYTYNQIIYHFNMYNRPINYFSFVLLAEIQFYR